MAADNSNNLESLLSIFQMSLNSHPLLVPPAICCLNQQRISKPNEMDWRETDILSEINSHLEQFTEYEPDNDYDNERQFTKDHNAWQERKNLHDKIAKQTKSMIIDHARSQWHIEGNLSHQHVHKSKIYDSQTLLSSINETFKRWRIAKEVDNFFEKLRQYAVNINTEMDRSSILNEVRNLDYTSNRGNLSKPFQSETSRSCSIVPIDMEDFNYEHLKMVDESQNSSVMRVDINRELRKMDILEKEYKELSSEFKTKLKHSWNLHLERRKYLTIWVTKMNSRFMKSYCYMNHLQEN